MLIRKWCFFEAIIFIGAESLIIPGLSASKICSQWSPILHVNVTNKTSEAKLISKTADEGAQSTLLILLITLLKKQIGLLYISLYLGKEF